MWSNPVVERNSMLFHILGAFLQLYPSLSAVYQVDLWVYDFQCKVILLA
jgi:hypothetical protein